MVFLVLRKENCSIEKGGEKMKKVKIFVICFLVLFLALGVMAPILWAAEEYKVTASGA